MTTNPIRHSHRIANTGCLGTELDKAQSVLMHKMGILGDQESLKQDACDAYVRLFEDPLSHPHLAAVASLFGWTVPENCEARAAGLILS